MNDWRLIIFDWDGTLMDSTDRIVECMSKAIGEVGLPKREPDEIRGIIGLGLAEAIESLYPGISAREREGVRKSYARNFVAAEARPSDLFPGAREVLQWLRDQQMLLAVATGKSRLGLDRIWAGSGLGNYFVSSRCSDESGSKPAPAMVNDILAETGTPREHAMVVGDTAFDMEMAYRAGVARVGVTRGAHPAERLAPYTPLAMLDTVSELPRVLQASEIRIAGELQ